MTAISSEWRAGIKKTPQLDEWKRQLAPPILIPSKLEQKYSIVTNKSANATPSRNRVGDIHNLLFNIKKLPNQCRLISLPHCFSTVFKAKSSEYIKDKHSVFF